MGMRRSSRRSMGSVAAPYFQLPSSPAGSFLRPFPSPSGFFRAEPSRHGPTDLLGQRTHRAGRVGYLGVMRGGGGDDK